MDWKVFFMTFSAIFVAELADKTQIVGIGLSAKSGKPFGVWLGSVSAYMVVTLISVIIGTVLGKYISPELIRYLGAAIFILMGALMLFKII
ncbi:MAG: TMEM165/GDT1 family protein [Candidatus Omnitrophica bacterium]|nr:TMEM165/GDT1 family protein [Candidatus Omnitrophota bacterium]MDD5237178.1 TMEM165/GDT1 family protein [Candidatus Omnitrophota bacterium]MDD5609916.1 TMEM165/GDT1 family protein [Candidatus Omnitrophota bacterium]